MAVSLFGLDLSFLKSKESQDAIKRMKARHLASKAPRAAPKRSHLAAPMVMGDLSSAYPEGGFKSSVDGSFITSRSQLAAHNKKHGVRQCGEVDPKAWTAAIKDAHEKRLAEPIHGVDFQWSKFENP